MLIKLSIKYIPENVSSIIEILGKVFGRPEFIINSLLESIRSEAKPKFDVFDSIIAYSLQVNNLCATMKSCMMSDQLWNLMLIQELVEKLATHYKSSLTSVKLEVFNNWLESKAVSLTSVLSRPPQLSKISKVSKAYLNIHSSADDLKFCVMCLKECRDVPSCPKFTEADYNFTTFVGFV